MKTSWKDSLTPEKKKEIELEFNSSTILRNRLIYILNKKIKSSTTETRLKASYDSPNWGLLQADAIGYERALLEVISLLE